MVLPLPQSHLPGLFLTDHRIMMFPGIDRHLHSAYKNLDHRLKRVAYRCVIQSWSCIEKAIYQILVAIVK